ncbi:MAG: hypothetical protein HWE26_03640 [Alteromonadaceae bacterium]|nr:hypothetical protein [Alteromonadaceae bacterium]
MTVHAIKPTFRSKADLALQVEKGHLWLHCFRTCSSCQTVSKNLTKYEFGDGSSLILDSSHDFPVPVKPEMIAGKQQYQKVSNH